MLNLGPWKLTLLHNFHIAQSIIVKVKVYALQEVRTFLDQLPKNNNSGEQQRHEHDNREKNCERDYIRRNSGDTDLFELQFIVLSYKEGLGRMCTPVRLSMFNLVRNSLCL
jgi:hypothetical protein